MFTGIIENLGKITEITPSRPSGASASEVESIQLKLTPIRLEGWKDIALGESIAVNGVCLTATESAGPSEICFFASSETLARSNLGLLRVDGVVNLERALAMGSRLSGHWVQGHVDGLATLEEVKELGESFDLRFSLPPSLLKYCVEKGSIALNGISLTLNSVTDTCVSVRIIPHTWTHTNLSRLSVGSQVNVEVDVLAKYMERLCQSYFVR